MLVKVHYEDGTTELKYDYEIESYENIAKITYNDVEVQ